ncbi:GDSL-type esterase/lipase family protein [Megalodesulfovibrio paquesii]
MILCFFGDSITNGVGDPQAQGWVGRLLARSKAAGHDLTGYNLGVRRHSSADILARFEAETRCRLFEGLPTRLVFSFGVADVMPRANLPLEATLDNTRQLLERSRALLQEDAQVLVVGPTPAADRRTNEAIAARAAGIAACCREAGVPFLDVFPELHESELYLNELAGGDGVHPGAAGYSHISRLVEAWSPWQDWLAPRPVSGGK